MRLWPVRGVWAACDFLDRDDGGVGGFVYMIMGGDGCGTGGEVDRGVVAEGCVRARREDGRGVMGFFVACFVREAGSDEDKDGDGPYVRDRGGRIVRGVDGMPTLKSTGRKVGEEDGGVEVRFGEGSDGEEPFERDGRGMIGRGPDGMPRLKAGRGGVVDDEEDGDEGDEWGGFDD
jgi:putative methyltransferase